MRGSKGKDTMEKTYYFIFNEDCFDRDNQRSNLAHTKKTLTKTIYDKNMHTVKPAVNTVFRMTRESMLTIRLF